MNKSSTLFLIAFLVFFLIIIPYLSLAESKDFSPEEPEDWPKIFNAVKNASEKSKTTRNEKEVIPSLILGVLNKESGYGTNLGKTKNGWKNYCEVEENKNKISCIYWNAYDCKSDYSNVGKTIKEGGKEKKINYFEEICNALGFKIEIVQTSFTCALGFTQFEPATWWDIKERHKEDALTNPWSYHDSILACGYKLKEDGASENEIIALTKYYGSADFKKYINPIFATAKLWEDNFLKPAATTFCKTPTDFLCALEKLKEISKKCCKTKESCNLYKIKEELKEQIKKEEEKRALEVQLESFEKSSPEKIVKEREKLQPEKSLLEKIKDATNETFASISSTITENFSKLKENLVQLNPFKKEIPIGRYENIDDEKDFVELKENRTFYSEQAFNFAIKGYGMKYETGFTLASSGKYVIQGSKIIFKIKRLISGGYEMEIPGIFSTKCALVENGFDCEDGTQYRKIKKKETKETSDLHKETGPAALVPKPPAEEKPKEEKFLEEIPSFQMPSFKSLNYRDYAIPYPDWPVLKKEIESDITQLLVGVNKGREAMINVHVLSLVGSCTEHLKSLQEELLKKYEAKILNSKIDNNKVIIEAKIKGEKIYIGDIPLPHEIEVYPLENYRLFVYEKCGRAISIGFNGMVLENKWLDYENIVEYMINVIDSLSIPIEEPLSPSSLSDEQRKTDLHNIRNALEFYSAEYGKYPNSLYDLSKHFGGTVPTDPNGSSYGWIDNTSEEQKYCIWTKLETKDVYFIASPYNAEEVIHLPTTLDECCKLSKP